MKKYICWAAFVLLAMSCTRQDITVNIDNAVPKGQFLTFKASSGDYTETKTAFQSSDASQWPVYWTPGDAINIFYGSKSAAKFETVASFTQAGPIAEFEGYLQAATGASDENGGVSTQNFWAVYPYNANNTCDGSSVTLTIPSSQAGVAGTFANNLNPTVACSPNMGLTFYNVGSWFIFTVTQENVVSATLTGVNGETLVGKVKVSMDGNGRPVIDQITNGETTITMVPEGGSFQVGEYYCMVILPQTFAQGVRLTLTKGDGATAVCTVAPSNGSPMVVARSKWARKKNADAGLTYVKEGNIEFADANVKAICVAQSTGWDTNGDGELSYTEAAAVTTIPYDLFSNNTTITSFDEFQYFTGVTSLEYDSDYDEGMDYYGAFYGCSALESIVLPSSLTDISHGAFWRCSSLEEITIPSTVTRIGIYAFYMCTNLDVIMESATPCTLYKDLYNSHDEPYSFGDLQSGTKVKAIYVPTQESVSTYKAATYWSTYSSIIKWIGERVPLIAAVDLGLTSGLKWASFNVGANAPEKYGAFFAWGETSPKQNYEWSTYLWCNGSSNTLTKYNKSSNYGTVDNKTQLELSDDAAITAWGGSWRMPTDAEWTELRTECAWTWTTQNENNGYLVTGPNGNSIFLPAAGIRYGTHLGNAGSIGYYWSSSLYGSNSTVARGVYFTSEEVRRYEIDRKFGIRVRPVSE